MMLDPDLPRIQAWLQQWREKTIRTTIKAFQLIKEEERRAFPKRFYFKLKKKHPEGIPEFDSDKEIKVERASTTSNKKLEFAEHPHEI